MAIGESGGFVQYLSRRSGAAFLESESAERTGHTTQECAAQGQETSAEQRGLFVLGCQREHYHTASDALLSDRKRMVTFYLFPKEHSKHLRTTNIVEPPFAALGLRTGAAKRYRKVEKATAVTWKMLMLAQRRFRRLDAPEKLESVYLGIDINEIQEAKRESVLAVA